MDTTELRRRQSELYASIMNLDPHCMELARQYEDVLDTDITMNVDRPCDCGYDVEFNLVEDIDQGRIDGTAECVRCGECRCRSATPHNTKTTSVAVSFVHLAAASNNTELLQLLESRGKVCHKQTRPLQLSPIFIAVSLRHNEVTDFLLSKDIDVNVACTPDDVTPLMQAIKLDDVDFVQKLLQTPGVDVNIRNQTRESPVMVALDNKEIFDLLVDAGADVNIKFGPYNQGNSLLMMAVTKGIDHITKLLDTEGIDVNCLNNLNETALHLAVRAGSTSMVNALLDAKANPDIVLCLGGGTPVLMAASRGDLPLVEILVKYGADVNIGDSSGYNAVHNAAWYRETQMLKLLLESEGVEHDKLPGDNNTPLALAAHGEHEKAVEMLLPLGCNVNNKDKDDDTALHYATYNGMTDTVRLLLQYGADPDVKDSYGITPLWNAVFRKNTEIVKMLLDANVELEVNSRGMNQHLPMFLYSTSVSPLYVAAHRDCAEVFFLLLSAGYDVSKEHWIFSEHQDSVADFISVLKKLISEPPRLLSICRNYFRRYGNRRKLRELVENLELPTYLKNHLLLTEILKDTNVSTGNS